MNGRGRWAGGEACERITPREEWLDRRQCPLDGAGPLMAVAPGSIGYQGPPRTAGSQVVLVDVCQVVQPRLRGHTPWFAAMQRAHWRRRETDFRVCPEAPARIVSVADVRLGGGLGRDGCLSAPLPLGSDTNRLRASARTSGGQPLSCPRNCFSGSHAGPLARRHHASPDPTPAEAAYVESVRPVRVASRSILQPTTLRPKDHHQRER